MLRVRHRGQRLNTSELEEIANNYIITKHAKERIHNRFPELNVTKAIKEPLLAYFNTDGSVNIALNEFEYLVVGTDRIPYPIITFKEKSHNNITIFEKQEMAQNGYNRKIV